LFILVRGGAPLPEAETAVVAGIRYLSGASDQREQYR
jgi:hypothetical protein